MSEHPVKRRKKLIEVAIPLEAINAASAREKSIRHGHPSTLHLWWARRPLAAARAVIFCQMVDDPSAVPEEFPTEEDQENERLRLFALISELVTWENTTNEQVLNRAREEIKRCWRRACADNTDHPEAAELFNPEKLPGFHDPFAGGGALPLEAQRLGLEAYASDLNPVAVLINKAMIEIPPKFAGQPPVNPESRRKLDVQQWKGAQGLAEDVRYYGKWMRDEAEKRLGPLYPKVKITPEMVNDPENPRPDLRIYEGQELTVIAWIWARTVKSPNPSFSDVEVPLASTFMLSTKTGKEAYVEPLVEGDSYRFTVKAGKPKAIDVLKSGTKLGRGGNFRCLISGSPMNSDYIKAEGVAGRMSSRMMAIVAEGKRGRIYLAPTPDMEAAALSARPSWRPDTPLPEDPRNFWTVSYGISSFGAFFTKRQLFTLKQLTNLLENARSIIATELGQNLEDLPVHGGKRDAAPTHDYAMSVTTYLALSISRLTMRCSSQASWDSAYQKIQNTFGRQSLPMVWDYVEGNPFCDSTGSLESCIEAISTAIETLPISGHGGIASQRDAKAQRISLEKVVSTDPPYYDNIAYADLSDWFYVWLRESLRFLYPDLFATLVVPKADELVATPYRHGGKTQAEEFFLQGMTQAIGNLAVSANRAYPTTIYYAFKQSERKGDGSIASTGWETFLQAVMNAGFAISGTWPVRTEMKGRVIERVGANTLASSIVLVCERRHLSASVLSRNAFRRELRQRLPKAIKELEHANIAPVDVAQAAIGPGMAIFSQAKAVLNPDDSPMSVRDALIEINAALDEYLSEDEGSFDADTRFALTFFESYGYSERPYGDAEGLAVARNISVQGVANAGILSAIAGKVQLLRREQLDADWDPSLDDRLCVWEATQHLIKALEAGGEAAAAALMLQLKQLPGQSGLLANCRALAYRLYNHCEKTKQAEEGRAYNGLVIAWQEIERQVSNQPTETTVQASLI